MGSGFSINVKVDTREVMRALNIAEREIKAAAAAALNDTANSVRGSAVKEIAAVTGMKQSDIRAKLWIKRATRAGLIAEVGALPSAKNVGKYKGANPRQAAGGVRLKAWGKPQTYRGTFVMGGKKGGGPNAAVWRRTGKADRAVTPVIWGPSVRSTFVSERLLKKHEAVVAERFPVFFERRLRGALKRAGFDLSGVGKAL